MPSKINKSATQSARKNNGTNRHRKKEPRDTRGTLRPEIQVSGGKTRNSRGNSKKANGSSVRGSGHGRVDESKEHRPPDQLGDRDHSLAGRNSGLVSDTLRIKMKAQRAEALLAKIANEHLIVNNTNVIFREGEEVHAFGKYIIKKSDSKYQIYRGSTLVAEPSLIKVAISWCVADKYSQNELAVQLLALDKAIEYRNADIKQYRYSLSRPIENSKKDIILDRLTQSIARNNRDTEQLDKCLSSAKYWQLKGFNNETSRIRIKN